MRGTSSQASILLEVLGACHGLWEGEPVGREGIRVLQAVGGRVRPGALGLQVSGSCSALLPPSPGPGMWRWSLHKKVERDPGKSPMLVRILLRELEKVGSRSESWGRWVLTQREGGFLLGELENVGFGASRRG